MDSSDKKELLTLRLSNKNLQSQVDFENRWVKKISILSITLVSTLIAGLILNLEDVGRLVVFALSSTAIITLLKIVLFRIIKIVFKRLKSY